MHFLSQRTTTAIRRTEPDPRMIHPRSYSRSAALVALVDPAGLAVRSGPSAPSDVAVLLPVGAAFPAASVPAWFEADCVAVVRAPPDGEPVHRASPKHRLLLWRADQPRNRSGPSHTD